MGNHRLKRRARVSPDRLKEDSAHFGSALGLVVVTVVFCAGLILGYQHLSTPNEQIIGTEITNHQEKRAEQGALSSGIGYSPPSEVERSRPSSSAGNGSPKHVTFSRCGRVRVNCVVDGDTIWLNGEKIRIADIDTPEIGRPKCQREYELGMAATRRLIGLLNEDSFQVRKYGDRDRDIFRRKLRVIVRGDSSLGDLLVREGLAHHWSGKKLSWC